MESLTKAVLGLALLVALRLGLQMQKGKSGRGNLADRKGMTIVRTCLIALLGPVMVWHLALPNTIPGLFLTNIPNEIRFVGLTIFVAGMALRIWSHVALGNQWSADLSLRADHQIVQSGPYGLLCHPIYYSYLLIAPGILFSTGNWLVGSLAIAYTLVSTLRIGEEEKMLLERFGGAYSRYREETLQRQRDATATLSVAIVLLLNAFGGVYELTVLFN